MSPNEVKTLAGGKAALEAIQGLVPGAVEALQRLFANPEASQAVVAQAAMGVLKLSLEYSADVESDSKPRESFKLIDKEAFHRELSRRLDARKAG